MTRETGNPSETTVTLNQLFATLSRAPRRRILAAILAQNPRQSGELVDGEPPPTDRDDETNQVELYHTHLPHLQDDLPDDWP